MLLAFLPSFADDFTKLSAFVVPIFAVMAGLQAKSSRESPFFGIFACLCAVGIILSLISSWVIACPDGKIIFSKSSWEAAESENFATWKASAEIFFDLSFQTFITFISVLFGLKAAQ